ncbi:hypothetical protein SALWKB2_1838 [Snodgrassella alvi wkB2]|nr:hypothetical protein SALWKB2_1838 [Snodgrassella alvi wkB2]
MYFMSTGCLTTGSLCFSIHAAMIELSGLIPEALFADWCMM